jgi:peptide/nickel transport system substrate-binding protein
MRKFVVGFLMVLVAAFYFSEVVVQLPWYGVTNFDPYYWQAQHILAQGTIFEGLFGYVPDSKSLGGVKVVPAVCESYTVSEDGLTYTFYLRKDKRWSNGDPVTAYDFEFAWKRAASPETPTLPLWASPVQYIKNVYDCKSGAKPLDELGVKALDDYTLQVTLSRPMPSFINMLVLGGAMPLHRKTVQEHPEDWWKPEYFVGNGPYVIESFTPNYEIVLVRNKYYVGDFPGNVDRIVLKAGGLGLQQYLAGEIDAVFITAVGDYVFALKNKQLSKELHEESGVQWVGYEITRSLSPVFDDIRIRKALAMAIDKKVLTDIVLGGMAIPTHAYCSPDSEIAEAVKGIPYDPEQAKKLLAEAGYPNGKGFPKVKFYITGASDPVAEALVDQWKKVLGITFEIENIESGQFSTLQWSDFVPWAEPGVCTIGGPVNWQDSGSLMQTADHTLWYYDYPAEVRQKLYELREKRESVLREEGGKTEEEWKEILNRAQELWEKWQEVVNSEPDEFLKKYFLLPAPGELTFIEQINKLYEEWKKATTDEQKIQLWRLAMRAIYNQEYDLVVYTGMNPTNREARRLWARILYSPYDEAVEYAKKLQQLCVDLAYEVPLYVQKVVYLAKPYLKGIVPYKFSWGPTFFLFKYLTVEK